MVVWCTHIVYVCAGGGGQQEAKEGRNTRMHADKAEQVAADWHMLCVQKVEEMDN